MTFPEPRPFQLSAIEKLREGIRQGHKKQILVAPTGSGKTILSMMMTRDALLKDKRVMFVCDRKTLINQTSEVADSLGLNNHGIIQAQNPRYMLHRPFQIASIQTLARRGAPEDFDLIFVDEAHSMYGAMTDIIAKTNAYVVGLTATPYTKGIGKVYSNLVNATTMSELTFQGVLVPLRVMTCVKINMKGAKVIGGEWSDREVEERGSEIVGDVVEEWKKHGENRKTIIFGATIKHCENMCRKFNDAGIPTATFTANTKEEERKELLDEFRKPDSILRVLISVEALAKGFDIRDIGLVADCRPLRKSLSTFIQMIGRGLRSSPETGKKDCILLDFSGNILRFADDFEEAYHFGVDSLDSGEKKESEARKEPDEKKDKTGCPKCGFKPFIKRCMSCGFEIVKSLEFEHEQGEMVEFVMGDRKRINKREIWVQSVNLCRNKGNEATISQRASHLYKSIVGEFPHGMQDYRKVPISVTSMEIEKKYYANAIRYKYSKNKKSPKPSPSAKERITEIKQILSKGY